MKNTVIEKRFIDFIKKYSDSPYLYWVPLIRPKIPFPFPVVSYNLDDIYRNNDIVSLENVFKICGISDVKAFQMDRREYLEYVDIFELLYEEDKSGYNFPWYVEAFYFDSSEKWLVYVSHEGTISFTGKKISEAATKCIDNAYILNSHLS